MSADTRAQVRTFIDSRFPLARGRGDDESLLDSNCVDSLGILDLAGFVGEKFGIELDDDALTPENFDSITAMVGFIDRLRASQPTTGGA
jgi:acyl carrier protein